MIEQSHRNPAEENFSHAAKDLPREVSSYVDGLVAQVREICERHGVSPADLGKKESQEKLSTGELTAVRKLLSWAVSLRRGEIDAESRREIGRDLVERSGAGVAFVELSALLKEATGDPIEDCRFGMDTVRALARAGEPKLAYAWLKELENPASPMRVDMMDNRDLLVAMMAIWESFRRNKAEPPFGIQTMITMADDADRWDLRTLEANQARGLVLENLFIVLAREGFLKDAYKVCQLIQDVQRKLNALMTLQRYAPGKYDGDLRRYEELVSGYGKQVQMDYWFRTGKPDRAMALYDSNARDPLIVIRAAEGMARLGNTARAFELLEETPNPGTRFHAASKMAVAFLERGDVENARMALGTDQTNWWMMYAEDVPPIVERLLDAGEIFLAKDVARALVRPGHYQAWQHAEAIRLVTNIYVERGLEPFGLLSEIGKETNRMTELEVLEIFQDSLREANVASALRRFKRAARTFATSVEKDGIWNRRAWEEAVDPYIKHNRELANALTYGEPIA